MRRTVLCGLGALAGLTLVTLVWTTRASQNGEPLAVAGKGPEQPLPIRHVVLFNSGVGYMQREGEVDGDARVDLSFPTTDINDLLKSLVLQDLGGGKISSVSYDSHDPVDKILRSFAIDLNNNPTFGQILNQARGEKIELQLLSKDKAIPARVSGTIVGMEVKQVREQGGVANVDMLNLLSSDGLQSIAMDQVLGVRFLNAVLENEFQRALRVLAGAHDTQKKTVTLGFNGPGRRAVRVGYVVERPIWKTTYRLRLEGNGKVFLQGWALVENTSDDDWKDVRMVLVSGRPISFRMNLYEPLYIPRPTVEPDQFASLRPPVYSGSMNPTDAGAAGAPGGGANFFQPLQPPAPGQAGQGGAPPMLGFQPPQMMNQFFIPGGGQMGQLGGGFNGFNGFGFNGGFNGLGGQMGQFGGNFALNNSVNPYQNSIRNSNANYDQNRLTYDELQQRRAQLKDAKKEAAEKGAMVAMNFKEGIQSVASAEEVGDYFQYLIDQRISLSRQKSAMLPIIDQNIEGSKVSIFNEAIHGKYPLLGLRLKNTSGQPLTQGPITVYDNATYAGDTRILDLQPNEERLLSYALDQATEVKSDVKSAPSPDMKFKVGEANLSAVYKNRETRTYTIRNRSTHDRVVVLEHAIRSGWELIDPIKAKEKTRSLYRFELKVPAGATGSFQVVEDQKRVDQVALKGGQPEYVTSTGIQVKTTTHVDEQKLVRLKAVKGVLTPTLRSRETKSFFVQNLSDVARDFTVDHVVRKEWVLLPEKDNPVKGPDVYRFTLPVEKGKTGTRSVVEERVHDEAGTVVTEVAEGKLRDYLNDAAVSDKVKAGLSKLLDLNRRLADTAKELADLEQQLKSLSADQARLRENLKIIPPTSEPYKKFLEKFVGQETEIDTLQRQIRTVQTTLATVQREHLVFIGTWTAE